MKNMKHHFEFFGSSSIKLGCIQSLVEKLKKMILWFCGVKCLPLHGALTRCVRPLDRFFMSGFMMHFRMVYDTMFDSDDKKCRKKK